MNQAMRNDLGRLFSAEAREARLAGNHGEAMRLSGISMSVMAGPQPPPKPTFPAPAPRPAPAPAPRPPCGSCK